MGKGKIAVAVFDTHGFEKEHYCVPERMNGLKFQFFEARLTRSTAPMAKGFRAVCSFANDKVDRECLETLKAGGCELLALRSAGFNHVDIKAAKELDIKVVRVPAYSPYAVAEHAVALLLCLNRKVHRAYNRVRESNFSLEGLVGTDLHGKTVGVVGTGKIGQVFCQIMQGFGCEVLAYDIHKVPELAARGVQYVELDELLRRSQIISLHLPLTPETKHLIDARAFGLMQKGAILINTGRGGLIDTKALVEELKKGKLGAAGLDVYEEEEEFFFQDFSGQIIQDDVLARLISFPNVIITSHQAFLTREALDNIAETTWENLHAYFFEGRLQNQVGV